MDFYLNQFHELRQANGGAPPTFREFTMHMHRELLQGIGANEFSAFMDLFNTIQAANENDFAVSSVALAAYGVTCDREFFDSCYLEEGEDYHAVSPSTFMLTRYAFRTCLMDAGVAAAYWLLLVEDCISSYARCWLA